MPRRPALFLFALLGVVGCLPIPHLHRAEAAATIIVRDRAGRPRSDATVVVYAGNIVGGGVRRLALFPVDSLGTVRIRGRREWHLMFVLIPDAEAPNVFGWCAEAPGAGAAGGVLTDERRQDVTAVLPGGGSSESCPESLFYRELERRRLVAPAG
jgi:hypothetical protein